MIAGTLRAAPLVSLGLLVVWTGWDVARVDVPGWDRFFWALLLVSAGLIIVGHAPWGMWFRRLGLVGLGTAYLGAHIVSLGVQVVPGLVFVTVFLGHMELRVLADRFASLYDRPLTP